MTVALCLPTRLAFVDIETTGARPTCDAITEIAIIRIEDGVETARWQSLIHPGRRIPPWIVHLIGITDAMVADAPPFAEVADTVATLLAGCVFVAHNVRFDHVFLRNAFAALEHGEISAMDDEVAPMNSPMLCTLRLARALYPGYRHHGLDALIARHGLACAARHRAMGDADAIWQFVQLAARDHSEAIMQAALRRAMDSGAEKKRRQRVLRLAGVRP